jgi:hypothetical protein
MDQDRVAGGHRVRGVDQTMRCHALQQRAGGGLVGDVAGYPHRTAGGHGHQFGIAVRYIAPGDALADGEAGRPGAYFPDGTDSFQPEPERRVLRVDAGPVVGIDVVDPATATETDSSSLPGTGSSTSTSSMDSGPPGCLTRTARIPAPRMSRCEPAFR